MNLPNLICRDWQSKDNRKIRFSYFDGRYCSCIIDEETEDFDIEFINQEKDCLKFYKDNELKLKITLISPTSINFKRFGEKNIDIVLEVC